MQTITVQTICWKTVSQQHADITQNGKLDYARKLYFKQIKRSNYLFHHGGLIQCSVILVTGQTT